MPNKWQKRGAPVVVLDAAEARRKIGDGNYTGALLDRYASDGPYDYPHF
ncbi:hypothetical protein CI41S_71710 [Bradyrhizobium ivorense]|nr:hypothetical protein CI41S_71710 [Bradyrhizobium ivorense]